MATSLQKTISGMEFIVVTYRSSVPLMLPIPALLTI
jgi:hypothetical protein